MTFGPITVNRPGASATVGIMGPIGLDGKDGKDGDVGPQGPAVFTPITAWSSGITYQAGSAIAPASYVSYQGSSYACTTLHTSGVFTNDLALGLWEPVALQGVQGDDGTPGSTWYAGSGSAPSTIIGIYGDFFFRTDTGDVFQKLSGTWTLIANIRGTAGNTILSGTGAPPNTVGNSGDFYLDLTQSAPRLFGPKANGAWPSSGISLLGAGSGSVNPSGAFTVGHLIGAGTNDGKTIVDLGAPGDAAFKNTGVLQGQLAAADDARITGALQASRALAELATTGPATQAWARQNLETISHGQILALALSN